MTTHPRVHPCPQIELIPTRLAVLHRFWPVVVNGWPETFRVMTVWASDGRIKGLARLDSLMFSVSFSIN